MKKLFISAAFVLTSLVAYADSAEKPSVYFIEPVDGATVTSPVTVKFGLSGFGVAPAGTQIEKTGHHHLIIDAPLPNLNTPIPADSNHKHFGKGQTETTIKLSPGKHTLQLLLGDGMHLPHPAPLFSKKITITVAEPKAK